jgi:hypothetical protein
VGFSVFTSITVSAMQTDTGVRMPVTSSPRSSSMLCCTSLACVLMLMAFKIWSFTNELQSTCTTCRELSIHTNTNILLKVCVYVSNNDHSMVQSTRPHAHVWRSNILSGWQVEIGMAHDSRRQCMYHMLSKRKNGARAAKTLHDLQTLVTTHHMSDIMHWWRPLAGVVALFPAQTMLPRRFSCLSVCTAAFVAKSLFMTCTMRLRM